MNGHRPNTWSQSIAAVLKKSAKQKAWRNSSIVTKATKNREAKRRNNDKIQKAQETARQKENKETPNQALIDDWARCLRAKPAAQNDILTFFRHLFHPPFFDTTFTELLLDQLSYTFPADHTLSIVIGSEMSEKNQALAASGSKRVIARKAKINKNKRKEKAGLPLLSNKYSTRNRKSKETDSETVTPNPKPPKKKQIASAWGQ